MELTLRKSNRKRAKIKLAMQGVSGSGKTYSSLVLAHGMTNDWSKIAIIDTENGSADLYAQLGEYKVLLITAPYTPESYIKAIDHCLKHGAEVLIIDSLSHSGSNLLKEHSSMLGNSFANWGKITPRLNALLQAILNAPIHIIATLRTKQAYVLSTKNGKVIPEKVGLKPIQRDGVDYEFTTVFNIDTKHLATASKDRTGLFEGKPAFRVTKNTGEVIQTWCNASTDTVKPSFVSRIRATKSLKELFDLFNLNPNCRDKYQMDFNSQKTKLTASTIPVDND